MRCVQLHHGGHWFQMRVPRTQCAKHSEVVRVNLQTADRDVARALGTALAARWLARFSQRDLISDSQLATTVGEQALEGSGTVVARGDATPTMAALGAGGTQELAVDARGRGPGTGLSALRGTCQLRENMTQEPGATVYNRFTYRFITLPKILDFFWSELGVQDEKIVS